MGGVWLVQKSSDSSVVVGVTGVCWNAFPVVREKFPGVLKHF